MRVSRDKRDRQKRRKHIPVAAFASKSKMRKLRLRDGGGNLKQTRSVWWIGSPTYYNDGLYGPSVLPPRL